MDAASRALRAVERRASETVAQDKIRVLELAESARLATSADALVAGLRSRRLTVNFHPDRLLEDRTTVAQGLLTRGRYLPQSQTGISSGGRFDVAGGQRIKWEQDLFGDAYEFGTAVHRPIYGALDITGDPFGGSPRFGSSYLVLHDTCADRTTFCVGDSHVGPRYVGTTAAPHALLAGLLEQALEGDALDRGLDRPALVEALCGREQATAPCRELDGYVEAQVHGGISLRDDVVSIVVDPSFAGSQVHAQLEAVAETFDIDLAWHVGSQLAVPDVPDDFRGPTMPPLATQIAGPGQLLDAATIGRATHAIEFTPPSIEGDPSEGPLQQLKYLWHCLLRFGQPFERAPGDLT